MRSILGLPGSLGYTIPNASYFASHVRLNPPRLLEYVTETNEGASEVLLVLTPSTQNLARMGGVFFCLIQRPCAHPCSSITPTRCSSILADPISRQPQLHFKRDLRMNLGLIVVVQPSRIGPQVAVDRCNRLISVST